MYELLKKGKAPGLAGRAYPRNFPVMYDMFYEDEGKPCGYDGCQMAGMPPSLVKPSFNAEQNWLEAKRAARVKRSGGMYQDYGAAYTFSDADIGDLPILYPEFMNRTYDDRRQAWAVSRGFAGADATAAPANGANGEKNFFEKLGESMSENKVPWAIGIILALAAIGGGGYFAYTKYQEGADKSPKRTIPMLR